MLDDFLVRAGLAAVGVALVAGPFGCFVVWRRMAYFGAALSHSALLGVALALFVSLDPVIGVLIQSLIVVPLLIWIERRSALSADAHLGIVAHGALALGIVLFAMVTWTRVDITAYLFGDLLAISKGDLVMIYGGGALVLSCLFAIARPLLAASVSREIAAAENLQPERLSLVFMLLVAGVIAIGMQVVGVLLIVSLLIIPAAAARPFSRTPEAMVAIATAIAVFASASGLWLSSVFDTPSGPTIVLVALAVFLFSLAPGPFRARLGHD